MWFLILQAIFAYTMSGLLMRLSSSLIPQDFTAHERRTIYGEIFMPCEPAWSVATTYRFTTSFDFALPVSVLDLPPDPPKQVEETWRNAGHDPRARQFFTTAILPFCSNRLTLHNAWTVASTYQHTTSLDFALPVSAMGWYAQVPDMDTCSMVIGKALAHFNEINDIGNSSKDARHHSRQMLKGTADRLCSNNPESRAAESFPSPVSGSPSSFFDHAETIIDQDSFAFAQQAGTKHAQPTLRRQCSTRHEERPPHPQHSIGTWFRYRAIGYGRYVVGLSSSPNALVFRAPGLWIAPFSDGSLEEEGGDALEYTAHIAVEVSDDPPDVVEDSDPEHDLVWDDDWWDLDSDDLDQIAEEESTVTSTDGVLVKLERLCDDCEPTFPLPAPEPSWHHLHTSTLIGYSAQAPRADGFTDNSMLRYIFLAFTSIVNLFAAYLWISCHYQKMDPPNAFTALSVTSLSSAEDTSCDSMPDIHTGLDNVSWSASDQSTVNDTFTTHDYADECSDTSSDDGWETPWESQNDTHSLKNHCSAASIEELIERRKTSPPEISDEAMAEIQFSAYQDMYQAGFQYRETARQSTDRFVEEQDWWIPTALAVEPETPVISASGAADSPRMISRPTSAVIHLIVSGIIALLQAGDEKVFSAVPMPALDTSIPGTQSPAFVEITSIPEATEWELRRAEDSEKIARYRKCLDNSPYSTRSPGDHDLPSVSTGASQSILPSSHSGYGSVETALIRSREITLAGTLDDSTRLPDEMIVDTVTKTLERLQKYRSTSTRVPFREDEALVWTTPAREEAEKLRDRVQPVHEEESLITIRDNTIRVRRNQPVVPIRRMLRHPDQSPDSREVSLTEGHDQDALPEHADIAKLLFHPTDASSDSDDSSTTGTEPLKSRVRLMLELQDAMDTDAFGSRRGVAGIPIPPIATGNFADETILWDEEAEAQVAAKGARPNDNANPSSTPAGTPEAHIRLSFSHFLSSLQKHTAKNEDTNAGRLEIAREKFLEAQEKRDASAAIVERALRRLDQDMIEFTSSDTYSRSSRAIPGPSSANSDYAIPEHGPAAFVVESELGLPKKRSVKGKRPALSELFPDTRFVGLAARRRIGVDQGIKLESPTGVESISTAAFIENTRERLGHVAPKDNRLDKLRVFRDEPAIHEALPARRRMSENTQAIADPTSTRRETSSARVRRDSNSSRRSMIPVRSSALGEPSLMAPSRRSGSLTLTFEEVEAAVMGGPYLN